MCGMTLEQCAEKHGVNVSTVSRLLKAAREHIETALTNVLFVEVES